MHLWRHDISCLPDLLSYSRYQAKWLARARAPSGTCSVWSRFVASWVCEVRYDAFRSFEIRLRSLLQWLTSLVQLFHVWLDRTHWCTLDRVTHWCRDPRLCQLPDLSVGQSTLAVAFAIDGVECLRLQQIFVYLPLSYPRYAASLFAANDVCRAMFAAGCVLFSRPMFINLGVGGMLDCRDIIESSEADLLELGGVSLLAGLSCLGVL